MSNLVELSGLKLSPEEIVVGLKWEGDTGMREITGFEGDKFLVRYSELSPTTLQLVKPEDMPRLIYVQTKKAAQAKVYQEEARIRKEAHAEADAAFRRSSLGRFLAGQTPMQAGRTRKALAVNMRFEGAVMSRQAIIEALIARGATLSEDGQRLLTGPNSFMNAECITKVALSYAAFLLADQKNPSAA